MIMLALFYDMQIVLERVVGIIPVRLHRVRLFLGVSWI